MRGFCQVNFRGPLGARPRRFPDPLHPPGLRVSPPLLGHQVASSNINRDPCPSWGCAVKRGAYLLIFCREVQGTSGLAHGDPSSTERSLEASPRLSTGVRCQRSSLSPELACFLDCFVTIYFPYRDALLSISFPNRLEHLEHSAQTHLVLGFQSSPELG